MDIDMNNNIFDDIPVYKSSVPEKPPIDIEKYIEEGRDKYAKMSKYLMDQFNLALKNNQLVCAIVINKINRTSYITESEWYSLQSIFEHNAIENFQTALISKGYSYKYTYESRYGVGWKLISIELPNICTDCPDPDPKPYEQVIIKNLDSSVKFDNVFVKSKNKSYYFKIIIQANAFNILFSNGDSRIEFQNAQHGAFATIVCNNYCSGKFLSFDLPIEFVIHFDSELNGKIYIVQKNTKLIAAAFLKDNIETYDLIFSKENGCKFLLEIEFNEVPASIKQLLQL
jgi:hypothetical protein